MPDKKDFPKLNTQARVDFYKKNNLKMDATTELPKEKAVKTKQTPKTRKKPTANEMKADGTNVPKLNLKAAKRAVDNDAIDLYQDARNGMAETKAKNLQQGWDRERITEEDKKRDKALEGGANASQYDADKISKSVQRGMKEYKSGRAVEESKSGIKMDYQLDRKDNQSIAKMIKKVKNSFSSSPVAALVFQPKNLNQHLENAPKPNATPSADEEEVTPDSKIAEGLKNKNAKEETLKIIGDAKVSGLNPK